jgi:hypothetical protein
MKKKRKRKTMAETLCGYCGMNEEDCGSLEECNYNDPSYCSICDRSCDCDSQYEAYKEQKADEYFESQE